MRKWAVGVVLAASLAGAAPAYAGHFKKYLPGQEGNQWTYLRSNPVAKFAPWTVEVDAVYYSARHLSAFPGFTDGVWMAWSGNTLFVWDASAKEWKTFLRFGASTGTKYTVDLGDPLWSGTQVMVKSKNATLFDPYLQKTFTGVVHFLFTHPGLADAGVQEYSFAPGVGLVAWSEQSIAGPATGWLGEAVIGGAKLGPVPFSLLESGAHSSFPVVGKNKVYLINSAEAWKSVYQQHDPGAAVPEVDFSKHTVVAVFAGQRNTSGYFVTVSSVQWDYPKDRVRITVTEATPGNGMVLMVITQPYAFAVLEKKVWSGVYEWNLAPAESAGAGTP